jgi:multidrug resistance efflux pump
MLNISPGNRIGTLNTKDYKSFGMLRKSGIKRLSVLLISGLLLGIFLFLFLPWTQNIEAKGYVTTLSPEDRPQAIQSIITGRLEEWYVREGDFVEAGDTIIRLSEVKNEYLDPELVERTSEQVDAKSQSVEAYDGKVKALENQYRALEESLKLKLAQTRNKIIQARNKISIDSTNLAALQANFKIAENQLERTQTLYDKGLKTQTELQDKELKIQESSAKIVSQQNKLLNQRNELSNLFIELSSIERDYSNKLAKSLSDKQSALTARFESVGSVAKLRNQLSNYNLRQGMYAVVAPQSGYVNGAIKKSIGEIIKEGTDIVVIMPEKYNLAIEAYLRPQDVPLMNTVSGVRLRFDGWPAIVISGWPEASTGVFDGKIAAVDRIISDKGKYRILISPDDTERSWPEELRIGTGVNAFILLQDVPIWYELWRQLNGFPTDYYTDKDKDEKEKEVKRKAPIKSVK